MQNVAQKFNLQKNFKYNFVKTEMFMKNDY